MDDPHRDALLDRREALEIGLAADDGEGPAVDRRPVLFVFVSKRHALRSHVCEELFPVGGEQRRRLRARKAAPRGRVACLAVEHEVVAVFCRGQGRGGRKGPRAALGAAADMQGDPFALRQLRREALRVVPQGAVRVHAGRRARANGDAQARLARVGDEAELRRGRDDRGRATRIEPDDEEGAPGREPEACRAEFRGALDQRLEPARRRSRRRRPRSRPRSPSRTHALPGHGAARRGPLAGAAALPRDPPQRRPLSPRPARRGRAFAGARCRRIRREPERPARAAPPPHQGRPARTGKRAHRRLRDGRRTPRLPRRARPRSGCRHRCR